MSNLKARKLYKMTVVKNEELRKILRSKIAERSIIRSSKENKELILEKTLKKLGIDKEKFKEDLEAVKKQGGLQLDIKK